MLLAPDRHARINGAVVRAHANATATHNGGAPFGVLFDRNPTEPFGGAASAAELVCAFDLASAPGLVEGGVLVINGVAHVVASSVEPDASGWVVVNVYPKA